MPAQLAPPRSARFRCLPLLRLAAADPPVHCPHRRQRGGGRRQPHQVSWPVPCWDLRCVTRAVLPAWPADASLNSISKPSLVKLRGHPLFLSCPGLLACMPPCTDSLQRLPLASPPPVLLQRGADQKLPGQDAGRRAPPKLGRPQRLVSAARGRRRQAGSACPARPARAPRPSWPPCQPLDLLPPLQLLTPLQHCLLVSFAGSLTSPSSSPGRWAAPWTKTAARSAPSASPAAGAQPAGAGGAVGTGVCTQFWGGC